MAVGLKPKAKPNFSLLALISFTASFLVARFFTSLHPDIVLVSSGIHIHHFWYGIALLAIGGWLGISYTSERIDRIAAILFGAGGGLIADEVGLLLTFENYWTEMTYTFVIVLLTILAILLLVSRYSKIIYTEFLEFTGNNASLYFGIFLAAVSLAFVLETDNTAIIAISSVGTAAALIIILVYFVRRFRKKAT